MAVDSLLDITHKPECYYSGSREDMIGFVPNSVVRVLDVGCGEGNFGATVKSKFNAEVWGVEIHKIAARIASYKLNIVISGNIEKDVTELPEAYFDCICFNDVLEHMQYPWNVLKKVARYLTKEGYILASIPNVRYLDNIKSLLRDKDWKYEDEGILDKTHLRFFTKKSICEMFHLCGYKIIRIEGINPLPFFWKFKLLNWIMGNRFDDMRYKQFACIAQKVDS